MDLKDLIGEHELSGVDFGTLPPDLQSYRHEISNTMTFVLDGHAYCVVEDPSDGYRSSMQDISEAPIESVKNRFEPVRVLARLSDKPGDEILQLIDLKTAKVVLEAGTYSADDYYPSFVANFMPEHMACNASQS